MYLSREIKILELSMMISRIEFSLCCMFIVLLSLCPGARSEEQPSINCPNTTTYNPNGNSTYRANLNFLLNVLSTESRTVKFYNFTAGLNTPNATYGLFLCRGDVTSDACEQCVSTAAERLLESCSDQKVATIWYEACMLRYSDQSFFSVLDRSIAIYVTILQNVTDVDRFNQVLGKMLDEIATTAANGRPSGEKFAVKESNILSFQKLYTLAQCTPDLSRDDCDTCLRDGISRIPECCSQLVAGRIFFPSCEIRYATSKFYNSNNIVDDVPTPAPPPKVASTPPVITPPTTTNSKGPGKRISVAVIISILVSVIVSIVLFVLAFFLLRRRSKKRFDAISEATDENDTSTAEFLQYSLRQVQEATNNFSVGNKIGGGGFGDVYKGKLLNGKEIAVKRLSRISTQGTEEFKTEIQLVAKLQHRNLVQLLGFCFEGEEKILIYEFVPNKSLDNFLFDPEKQPKLDWSRRWKIIEGVARGLLYLHEDSRFRIVHRDLKAGNVLLDLNMNPKIADFGMAKLFRFDQSVGNTERIAGTFGYMAPEYAMRGQFSVKSDVYSFGVLVLEIISGKRKNDFYQPDHVEDLSIYAWKNWRNGTPLALLDPILGNSYARDEVIKCIHIGLLCVQKEADRRPTMASVVMMLNHHSVTMPAPHRPAYLTPSNTEMRPTMDSESDKSTDKLIPASVNDASITEPYPR